MGVKTLDKKASQKKASGQSTILWWIGWITLTILTFFVSATIWTKLIAKYIGTMNDPGVPLIWVAAVFGTWVLALIPLIVVMYNKVDKAYDEAKLKRELAAHRMSAAKRTFRAVSVDPENRTLPQQLQDKIKKIKNSIKDGHLVHLKLHDGRIIQNAFIIDNNQIIGLYGHAKMDFNGNNVVDLWALEESEAIALTDEKKWLRLDGISARELQDA